jgi:hypothetical protein
MACLHKALNLLNSSVFQSACLVSLNQAVRNTCHLRVTYLVLSLPHGAVLVVNARFIGPDFVRALAEDSASMWIASILLIL